MASSSQLVPLPDSLGASSTVCRKSSTSALTACAGPGSSGSPSASPWSRHGGRLSSRSCLAASLPA
eukprot:11351856-Alexandrium_andersonii.AAC.1